MESLIHRICALRLTQICYKNATASAGKIKPLGALILVRKRKKNLLSSFKKI